MNIGKQLKKVGNYQLLQSIGKGANAIVYKGLNCTNGHSVAIKQIAVTETEMKGIQSQINLLRQLEHKHIVKYIDAIQADDFLYIVLEYIEGGNLANLVKKASLNQKLVKVYVKQIVEGLDYLHQMGVVHRDIKGANILLTKEGIVKLADFGGAMRLTGDNKTFSMMGTPYWMAPQMIENKGEISTSCDIWSLGCTIIELLTGKPPYFQLLPYPALLRIVQDVHPPFPAVSKECNNFMERCFEKEPSKRPKASRLLHDAWFLDFQGIDQKYIDLDIKTLLKQRNYAFILQNLNHILNKKIIYTNPLFIQLLYDIQSQDKAEFFLHLLKQDYECMQYFCSIGLFTKLFDSISPAQTRFNKLCAQMIYQIIDLCMKQGTLSIFMSICIQPLKTLFFLQEQKRCMKVIHRLFSQQIIPISHLGCIICKQGLLIRILIYTQSILKSNPKEVLKTLTIVQQISSSKQSFVQKQFQPVVQTLVNLFDAVDRIDITQKILKTIYNISKHPLILQQFYNSEIVTTIINYLILLNKKPVKDEQFDVYYYALKIVLAFASDEEGLEKLRQCSWKHVLEQIQIKQIVKKDIQEIYQILINKAR